MWAGTMPVMYRTKTPCHTKHSQPHCSLVKGGVVHPWGGHVGWDHACEVQNTVNHGATVQRHHESENTASPSVAW